MEKFKAAGLGSASTAGQTRPSTEIDTVTGVLTFAQQVADRAEGLANRLLGSIPSTGVNGLSAVEVQPDGVLPVLAAQAVHTRDRLGDALAAIERIERALP